jgi:hypothetical protein
MGLGSLTSWSYAFAYIKIDNAGSSQHLAICCDTLSPFLRHYVSNAIHLSFLTIFSTVKRCWDGCFSLRAPLQREIHQMKRQQEPEVVKKDGPVKRSCERLSFLTDAA